MAQAATNDETPSSSSSVAQRRGVTDVAMITFQSSVIAQAAPTTTSTTSSHFAMLRSPRGGGGGGVVGDGGGGGVGGLLQQMTVEHVASLHKLFVDEGMLPILLNGGSGGAAGGGSGGVSPTRRTHTSSGVGGGGGGSTNTSEDMSALCLPIHRFCDAIFRILSASSSSSGAGGGGATQQHLSLGALDHSSSWVASKTPQALRDEIYRWSVRISTPVEGVRPRPSVLGAFALLSDRIGMQNDAATSSSSSRFLTSPAKRGSATSARGSTPSRSAAAVAPASPPSSPERLLAFQVFDDGNNGNGGGGVGKSPRLVVRWSDVTSCFIQDEETKDMAEENRTDFVRLSRKIVRCQVHHMHACSPSHALVTSTGRSDTKVITGGRDGVVKVWTSSTSAFESTISNSGESWVVGLSLLNCEHHLMVATSNGQVLVCDFPKGNVVQVYLGCSNLDAAVDEVTLPSVVHTHRFGMTPGESGPRQVHFTNVGDLTQEAFTEKRRTARSGPQTRTVAVKPIVGYISPTTLRYIDERGLCFFGNVHGTVGYFDLTEDLRQASLITGSSVKSIRVAFSVSVHLEAAVTAIRYVRRLSMLLTAGMDGCIYKISMEGSNWTQHAMPVRHNVQDTGARPILGMEWSESAQMLVTFSSDRTVKFWSLMRSEPLHVLDSLAADVLSITLVGRDRVAVLTADKTISIFELRAFRVVQTIVQSVTGENSGGQLHVCSPTIIKSHGDEGGCLLYDEARSVLTCCLRSPVQYASGAALSALESNPQHHNSATTGGAPPRATADAGPDPKQQGAVITREGDSGGGIAASAAPIALASPSALAATGLLTPRSAAAASSGTALRAVSSPVTQHQHPLLDLVVQRANMQAFSIDDHHVFSWDIASGRCLAVATVARQLQKVVMPPHARGGHLLTKCGWAGAENQLLLCGTQSGCLLTWNAGMNGIVRVDAVAASASAPMPSSSSSPSLLPAAHIQSVPHSRSGGGSSTTKSPRSPRALQTIGSPRSAAEQHRTLATAAGAAFGGPSLMLPSTASSSSSSSFRAATAAADVSCIAHLGQHALVCSANRVTLVSYDLSVQFPDGNHRSTLRTTDIPTRTSITAARFLRDAIALIGTLDATLFLCSLDDGKTLFSTRVQDRNGEDEVCGIEEIVVLNRRKQNVALVMLEHGAMDVWHAGSRLFVHHVRFFRKYDGRINAACVSFHEEFLTVGDTYGRVFVYDVRAVSSATSDWRSAIQHLYYFQASTSPIVALGLQERVDDDVEDLFLLVGSSDGSLRLTQLQRDGATHVGVFGEDAWDWSAPETFSRAHLAHHAREPRHMEGDMFLEKLLKEAKRRDDSSSAGGGGQHHKLLPPPPPHNAAAGALAPPATAATASRPNVVVDSDARGDELEAGGGVLQPVASRGNANSTQSSGPLPLAPHRPQTQHHRVKQQHHHGSDREHQQRDAEQCDAHHPFDLTATQFLLTLPSVSGGSTVAAAAQSLQGTIRLDGTLNGVPLISPWKATPPSTAPGGSRAALAPPCGSSATAVDAMSSCLHVRKRFIQAPDIDLGNGQHIMDRLTEQSLLESKQERSSNPLLPHYRRYGYHPPGEEGADGVEIDVTMATMEKTDVDATRQETRGSERDLSVDSAVPAAAKGPDFFLTAVGSITAGGGVERDATNRNTDDGVPNIAVSPSALDDGDPLQPQPLAHTTSNVVPGLSRRGQQQNGSGAAELLRRNSVHASSYVATSYTRDVDELDGMSAPGRSAEEEAREHTRQLLFQMAARLDLVQPNNSPQRKFMRRVERLYESEELKEARRRQQQQKRRQPHGTAAAVEVATSPLGEQEDEDGGQGLPILPSRETNDESAGATTTALDNADDDDQSEDILSFIRSPQTAKNFRDLEEKLRQYKKHREGILRQPPPPAPPPAAISVAGSLQSPRPGAGGGGGLVAPGGGGGGGGLLQPRRPITVQDPLWLTRVSSQLYLEDVVFTLPSTVAAAMYGGGGGPGQHSQHQHPQQRGSLHRGLSLFGASGNLMLSPAAAVANKGPNRHGQQPRTAR